MVFEMGLGWRLMRRGLWIYDEMVICAMRKSWGCWHSVLGWCFQISTSGSFRKETSTMIVIS